MPSGSHYALWVVTALVGFINGQFPDQEYCDIRCPEGRHTMCAYKPIGPNCQDIRSLMNEDGRMKILSLHNSVRNDVAAGKMKNLPSSSNMRQVYWDVELEAIAERWAMQCNASFNDNCRNVIRFKVGQVMSRSGILSTDESYYEALITKLWFPEMENLNEGIIMRYRQEKNVKHVAQILSANLMRIGCADVLYTTTNEEKAVRVTVCNYGPIISNGEQIYRIGPPCSECPQHTECRGESGKYPSLCNELRLFDVVELKKSIGGVEKEYNEYDVGGVDVESKVFDKEHGYLKKRKGQQGFEHGPSHSGDVIGIGGRGLDDNANNATEGNPADVSTPDVATVTAQPRHNEADVDENKPSSSSEANKAKQRQAAKDTSKTTSRAGATLPPPYVLFFLIGLEIIALTTTTLR